MSLLSTTGANQSLNALDASGSPTNLCAFAQLHTASTSTTGANEMGSVTRQANTMNAAASSAKTNSGTLSWTTPNTTPATHIGFWSAVTSGTFGIGLVAGASVQAVTITAAAGALSLSSS